jgi:hypothetical protein
MRDRLADFVFWFHMFWILLMLSGFIGIWVESWRDIHLGIVMATIVSQIVFMGCPLVLLEQKIRREDNCSSFVVYCLERWCGIKVNSWVVLGVLGCVFFGALWLQRR